MTKQTISLVEEHIQAVLIPSSLQMGHLPSHMGGGVTEQWLNWANYYSLYCLHRILPSEHIECGRLLVLSSRTLCKPFLSRLELALAKGLMSRFCERFESLYGSNSVTPNLHMHSHLADCSVIMDSYILFGYLAMNAIVASSPSNEPSNNRSIELQLLKQFINDNLCYELLHYQSENDEVGEFFLDTVAGYAQDSFTSTGPSINIPRSMRKQKALKTASGCEFIPALKYTIAVLSTEQHTVVKAIYVQQFQDVADSVENGDLTLPVTYKRMTTVHAPGYTYTSDMLVLARNLFPFEGHQNLGHESVETFFTVPSLQVHYFVFVF